GNRNRNTVVGWAIRGPKHGYVKGLRGAHVAAFVVPGDSDRRSRINSETSALRRIINQGHIAAAEVHGCAIVGDGSTVAAGIGHDIGNRNRNAVVRWA